MNSLHITLKVATFFVILFNLNLTFAQQISTNIGQSEYLPIDSLIRAYEQKNKVRIYYNAEWFENRKLHISTIDLPSEDFFYRLLETGKCSMVALDSATFVLVLPEISTQSADNTRESNSEYIVGNINEFGKYKRATLSGTIVDGKNGDPLPGVRLYINKLKTGTTTDKSGKYAFELPVGDHDILLAYMGYEESVRKVKLISSGKADFEIFEKSFNLSEITITSRKANINIASTQMSMVKLNSKEIKELPLSLGEVDLLKSITLLPGIQSSGELGTGFFVRGGGADQNLVLLEDIPVFNSSHLYGLTSILNSDCISSVNLYKAGIPARYGERASSVLDIRLGSSNKEKVAVSGGIGIINSKINVELPLVKNKANLYLSGRTTYSDWVLKKVNDVDLMNSSAGFSDLSGLLSFNVNKNNKLSFSGYYSKDKISGKNSESFDYSNLLGSVRWNHIFNSTLFSSLVVGFSKYAYNMGEIDTVQRDDAYKIRTSLLYKTLKYNVTWIPSTAHSIDLGVNGAIYNEEPGKLSPFDSLSFIKPVELPSEKAVEYGIYASDNISLTDKLGAEIGLRYSGYRNLGPASVFIYNPLVEKSEESITDTVHYGSNKTIAGYSGFEPRISFRYTIDENSSVKFSYNRINQYVNLVSNTTVMNPADIWKLSNTYVKPLKCDQFAVGYYRNFKNDMFETSLEVYYKQLKNIIEYKNGASLLVNPTLDADLVNAKGFNYGVELYVKKSSGRLTGWFTYAYSTSQRRTNSKFVTEQVNKNAYFPSVYDKPHNFNLIGNYHISRRWRFSWAFTYSTGRPITLPEYRYFTGGSELVYYSDRNKYRLPDYHRLDISITRDESLKIKKFWKGSWTLSVINVYSRKNLYSSYYLKEKSSYNLYALYIIGRPLPTLTYNFYF